MSFTGTVSQVAGLQTSKYFNVAGLAILIFDYAITLEDEARWVWGRDWDVTRFVFTLSRYIPFAGAGMTAYVALRSNSDPCGPSLEENIIHILGIIAAEVLLILRTYAYWQGDKRVLYGLIIYASMTIAAAVGINVGPKQLFPGAQAPPGCFLTGGRNGTLVYLLLLVFEMVILFLTVYKHFRSYREVRTSTGIVYTIYRDGMFYIICIILITLANTIVDGAFPFQFSDLLDLLQITLHSVLASRIMFDLRKSSYCLQKGTATDSVIFSDDAFYPPLTSQSGGSESSGRGSRGLTSVYVDVHHNWP